MSSSYEDATCPYFSSGRCGSCALLGITPGSRVATKETSVLKAITECGVYPERVEPIRIPKHPWGSRAKTKVSVTGSSANPILGIVRSDLSSQDLSECPLTPPHVQRLLSTLKQLIGDAKLTPYNITERTGELKHLIITHNHDTTQGILRFVLRSSEAIARISKSVETIQALHPWVTVITCNVQPVPAAILEGPDETILTERSIMEVLYNDVPLAFMPQSFMQVTHEIAASLYHRAATYVRENSFSHALDLFCGVGGFSLAIAPSVRSVTGVEVSPMAVASARRSASHLAISNAHFIADDVESYLGKASSDDVDLVIVNPPRRGLSEGIRDALLSRAARSVLYSSCDPETFARDLKALTSRYNLRVLAPFDMFPMTDHCEVLGILELR